jgi:hypothetical protein
MQEDADEEFEKFLHSGILPLSAELGGRGEEAHPNEGSPSRPLHLFADTFPP